MRDARLARFPNFPASHMTKNTRCKDHVDCLITCRIYGGARIRGLWGCVGQGGTPDSVSCWMCFISSAESCCSASSGAPSRLYSPAAAMRSPALTFRCCCTPSSTTSACVCSSSKQLQQKSQVIRARSVSRVTLFKHVVSMLPRLTNTVHNTVPRIRGELSSLHTMTVHDSLP